MTSLRSLHHGMDVSQIGTIINATIEEANAKIREYENIAERLALWRSEYAEELNMVGKFMTGKMPAEVRVVNYYDETDHIVHYLNNNLHFEKNEWLCVSLSFFCAIVYDILYMIVWEAAIWTSWKKSRTRRRSLRKRSRNEKTTLTTGGS